MAEGRAPSGVAAGLYDLSSDRSAVAGAGGMTLDPALQPSDVSAGELARGTRESSTTTNGNIAFNDLQNPSDALGIL